MLKNNIDLTRKKKEPFVHLSKRANINKYTVVGYYVLGIVVALAIGAIMIAMTGVNPFKFYGKMITIGTVGNKFAYKNVQNLIIMIVPLLLTSLALSLSFKMKFWNIGGEGQFIVGAIAASTVALGVSASMPKILVLLLMVIAGALSAGMYGLFTAVLKVKFGTNETLLTLMLNYIALNVLKYLETSQGTDFFLNPNSNRPIFGSFNANSAMPFIKLGKFELNIYFLIAIAIVFLLYIYLNKTKHGYEISIVGDSHNTARYAGIKVNKVILRTMFLSALMIGVAGAFKVSTAGKLAQSITGNVGWTGIIVAWLSKLNPIAIFFNTILISILQFGCKEASAEFLAVDSNIANLLQGLILFIVLAIDFFVVYKVKFNFGRKKVKKAVANSNSDLDSNVISDIEANQQGGMIANSIAQNGQSINNNNDIIDNVINSNLEDNDWTKSAEDNSVSISNSNNIVDEHATKDKENSNIDIVDEHTTKDKENSNIDIVDEHTTKDKENSNIDIVDKSKKINNNKQDKNNSTQKESKNG